MPIANITLDCVNGISKQDAETLKALPETLDAIEDSIGDANTEIDGIKDSIEGLDDRVTILENTPSSGGNDYRPVSDTDDWGLFDDSNRLILFRNYGYVIQLFVPKGQTLDILLKHILNYPWYYNTSTNEYQSNAMKISEIHSDTTTVFKTTNTEVKINNSNTITKTNNTTSGITKKNITNWNVDSSPGCIMFTDKPSN